MKNAMTVLAVISFLASPAGAQEKKMSESECVVLYNQIRPLADPEECREIVQRRIELARLCAQKSAVYGHVLMKRLYPQCLTQDEEKE
jgi:hypothetical protein